MALAQCDYLKEDGSIDEEKTEEMFDYAIENGVNYFDTAYPYMEGKSELVVGKILKKYPRESFYLADKFPGHQIMSEYKPEEIFEEQLKKCQVDYFDFYLLHNVCENSWNTYNDEKWGILDYFIKQKQLGRIKHLGFSSDAQPETLKKWIEKYEGVFEFCQIQMNYMDYTLQQAKEKYELLTEHGIAVWVMEPVRGGKLANLPEQYDELLKQLQPERSVASWCFNFLKKFDNIKMILSGMSEMEQVVDNVETFSYEEEMTDQQVTVLFEVAEGLKDSLPCTKCRYCTEGCPMGLDIPMLIAAYNDLKCGYAFTVPMYMESISDNELPHNCIGCGACAAICPQGIDIPTAMTNLTQMLNDGPKWSEVCKKREQEALQNKKNI